MSGEPNVMARLLSYSACPNSTHHLPAQSTPPGPQFIAGPTPSSLWGLKPLFSSPSFLQILRNLPYSTGLKSVFYFACCHCPSSSPYHQSLVSLALPRPSSPMPTLHTADRHLPKIQISRFHPLALLLTPSLCPGWICQLLSENDLLPCSCAKKLQKSCKYSTNSIFVPGPFESKCPEHFSMHFPQRGHPPST